MFLPHFVQSTRITSHSQTLIDNIFSNYIYQEIISGSLAATISDHLKKLLMWTNKKQNDFSIYIAALF